MSADLHTGISNRYVNFPLPLKHFFRVTDKTEVHSVDRLLRPIRSISASRRDLGPQNWPTHFSI